MRPYCIRLEKKLHLHTFVQVMADSPTRAKKEIARLVAAGIYDADREVPWEEDRARSKIAISTGSYDKG